LLVLQELINRSGRLIRNDTDRHGGSLLGCRIYCKVEASSASAREAGVKTKVTMAADARMTIVVAVTTQRCDSYVMVQGRFADLGRGPEKNGE
jgi:hypothetical protein